MKNTIVLGASSYYEISELISDINSEVSEKNKINVIGLLDDNEELIEKKFLGVDVIGKLSDYQNFPDKTFFIFGIGSHRTHIKRWEILSKLKIRKERFLKLIHPSVKIFSTSLVDYGCIVHYGTIIFNNTIVGPFTILMASSVIGGNNLIGEGCCITSQVVTTNGVKIGNYSFIGTNSSIGENVEIAPGTMIGMNCMVSSDTGIGDVRFGVPSRKVDLKEVPKEIISDWNEFKKKHFLKT